MNGCIWRVRFSAPDSDEGIVISAAAKSDNAAIPAQQVGLRYDVEVDAPARGLATDVYIYVAEPAVWLGASLVYTQIQMSWAAYVSSAFRIYALDCYVPDVDAGEHASEALADGFMRSVPPEVATVDVQELGAATQSLDLTPATGSALTDLRVERTSYRITVEEGVITTYHVGQAFEPDLEAQRIVLERLARKANNNEPVSKPRAKS